MPNALKKWRAQAISSGAATATDIGPVPAATEYLYVTKLVVTFVTHVNAKNHFIQDSTGTPVVYAIINDLTVATGLLQNQPIVFDWPRGLRLTLAKKLQVLDEASGGIVCVYAEGFTRTY